MQSDNTDNMMFPVAEMLVYVTQGMTLEPGDVIFTGTPSGVGHARKPNPVWMKNGDVCEIEIEGIGDAAQSDCGRGVAPKRYDPLQRGLSERVDSIGAGVEGGRTRRSS